MPSLCACGCCEETRLATRNIGDRGIAKGQPMRFISGHNIAKGNRATAWKGGRGTKVGRNGERYVLVLAPEHHRAGSRGYVYEHILIAEKALGRPLEKRHPVHHVDENTSHNANVNLVVCENNAYHKLLHQRIRALRACGNPNWRRCSYCARYDTPDSLVVRKAPQRAGAYHPSCRAQYESNRRHANA